VLGLPQAARWWPKRIIRTAIPEITCRITGKIQKQKIVISVKR
jgi:hypothetical protein